MTGQIPPPGALTGLRILELGDELSHYCGKLLADLGAEVIKVEPPGGAASRLRGPFAGGQPHPERSLHFLYFNANKYSVTLDLEGPAGRDAFRDLAAHAGAVIESYQPGYLAGLGLDYGCLSAQHPGLVMASISGFGQTGPYSHYQAPDLVAFAMGGQMALTGNAAEGPLAPPLEVTSHFTGVHAAHAVLVAMFHQQRTGRGQYLDISMQELQAQQERILVNYSGLRQIPRRAHQSANRGRFTALDGDVTVNLGAINREHWRDFVHWLGDPPGLEAPEWSDRGYRTEHMAELSRIIAAFAREQPKRRLYEEGQARRFVIGALNTPAEYITDTQVLARDHFLELHHPLVGAYRAPGYPYRLSATPARTARSAPLLGEHNALLPELRAGRLAASPASGPRPPSDGRGAGALDGVRVLDFTWATAGPYLTSFLAEQGAQVIKVESSARFQVRGTRPGRDPKITREQRVRFADKNRGKLGITLDLGKEQGRALARRLAAVCDVVVDNFSAHVMTGWGMDYPALRTLKPDIIVASLPGFGMTGPHRDFMSTVEVVHYLTGLSRLWNYPGASGPAPMTTGFADYNGGAHGAVAIMAALLHRERTGEGQFIDVGQVEAMSCLLGTVYLDVLLNGAAPQPQGNTRPDAAPYGCYRCLGDDRWCVIAVVADQEWEAFCEAIRPPGGDSLPWTQDPRFSTAAGRVAHRAELDQLVEGWTAGLTPLQVTGLLQEAGVAAGAVQDVEALYCDPQLRARGFIVTVDHPGIGPLEHPGALAQYSETPSQFGPYPQMGEHNHLVFRDILELPEAEFQRLVQEQVIA